MTKIAATIYYAIQHKPTGYFLPYRKGNRGFTWDEPRAPDKGPPRLFTRKSDAVHALNWWLRGQTGYKWMASNWLGAGGHELCTDSKPDRKAEDMVVVQVVVMTASCHIEEITCLGN